MTTVWTLVRCLLETQLLELPFGVLWGLKREDRKLLLLVNCVTNPLAVLWHGGAGGFLTGVLLPELVVVAAEGAAFRRWGKEIPHPLLFGLCVNAFSLCAGFLLHLF